MRASTSNDGTGMNRYTQGAPGVFIAPEERPRALVGARMDVCAFVGAAARGPARPLRLRNSWSSPEPLEEDAPTVALPVAVESLEAYHYLYGEDAPGLLAHALRVFFDQGGLRAYVVRIVVGDESAEGVVPPATACGLLRSSSPVDRQGILLRARNEGAWGNRLRAELSFKAQPIALKWLGDDAFQIEPGASLAPGDLLRLSWAGGASVLTFTQSVESVWAAAEGRKLVLARMSNGGPTAPDRVELIEAVLMVEDSDGRVERHDRLGCSSLHLRWMAKVLYFESTLLYPDETWADTQLDLTDALLPTWRAEGFHGGADRWAEISPEDLFGRRADPTRETDGLYAISSLPDVASLCVPDLFASADAPVSRAEFSSSVASGVFERCVEVPALPHEDVPSPLQLTGLMLDPRADLEELIGRQLRLVEFAARQQSFIALLDVPPGLTRVEVGRWRQRFASPFAAAYHPWLKISVTDGRLSSLLPINPSAAAAGIIAQRELAEGIPRGPANVLAIGVLGVEQEVSPTVHDELHALGINAFVRDRDGFRLMGARTLSVDPSYRQLSVRRLVTMLRRTIDQQMQWAVFEPNDLALRAELTFMLRSYLRSLYRSNAFRGATEDEAFFVRCDDELNPRQVSEAGQLLVEVGVAPAEPLEFIVLRIARDNAGLIEVAS